MRPASGEKQKDKRRKRGTGGTSPDSRNVDRISPSERRAYAKKAREVPGDSPARRKRDAGELARFGFVGASEREKVRQEERRLNVRLAPRYLKPEEIRRGEEPRTGVSASLGASLLRAPSRITDAVRDYVVDSTIQMGEDALWSVSNPIERLRGRGRAANSQMVFPGMGRFPRKEPKAAPSPGSELPKPEQISPGVKVRESLGPARARRAAQEGLYREERGKRVGAAEEASEAVGGGIAGHQAAKAQLRGELPKVKFEKLREGNLSQNELDGLFRTVDEHPDLQFYEKVRTREALWKAFDEGRTPTKSEIRHLSTVFGQDSAKEVATISRLRKAGRLSLQALNIPRSFMSTLDVSGTLRQALVATMGHPKIVGRNMGPQFKALVSEKNFGAIMAEIETRPNRELYEQGRLALTDLTDDLASREEAYMSNMAETITGGKYSPVRASGRAYTGLLNKTRADLFDHLLDVARAGGHNVENRKFLRDLGRYVNASTGRGNLAALEKAAPVLNTIFFSPRLAASRIDLLFAPATYARTHPFVRKQALKSMLRLYAAGSLVLGAAAYAGAQVGLDPRNADFAKLRIGNTRIDVFGGFQQYVRLLAQLFSGKIVSSTTGETLTLGAGFGDLSRKDIAERFAASKFSPPVSFVYDFFKGTDFEGQPFSVKKAALQRLAPFIVQDVIDMYRETGSIPATVGSAGLISVGIGTQTYGKREDPKAKPGHWAKELTKWKDPAEKAWQQAHPGTSLPVTAMRAKQAQLMVQALNAELKTSLKAREVPEQERTPEEQNAIEKQDLAAHFAVAMKIQPALASRRSEYQQLVRDANPAMVKSILAQLRGDLYQRVLDDFSEQLSAVTALERQRAFAK